MPIGEIPPSFCWYDPISLPTIPPAMGPHLYHHHKPSPRWDIFLKKNTANRFGTQKHDERERFVKNLQFPQQISHFSPYMTWLLRGFYVHFFSVLLCGFLTPKNHRPPLKTSPPNFSAPRNSNLRLGARLAWLGCRFGACLGVQWGTGVIYMTRWGLKSAPTT